MSNVGCKRRVGRTGTGWGSQALECGAYCLAAYYEYTRSGAKFRVSERLQV